VRKIGVVNAKNKFLTSVVAEVLDGRLRCAAT
jgi:hypothetical protein